jgi:sigma-B regulation protein RsbU (phosphoserine phosphatase)
VTGEELAGILVGAALLVVGFASAVASTMRPWRSSRILLSFGLAVGMYGARLVASQGPVRTTIGEDRIPWGYVVAFVTYLINIPLTVLVAAIIGPGWRSSTRWVAYAAAAFAIIAIVVDLALARPRAASPANSWLVLIMMSIALVNILHASRVRRAPTIFTERPVVIGALVFAAFVINENVGQPVMRGTNIEPIGMLVFVLSLGYALVRSLVRAETEFAAVQRELDTARRIQSSLLPRKIPEQSGLDIAVRFVPMTAVAGDIYDFVRIGPSSIGILVADVSGHGVPAALVASMVKVAFSAHADRAGDPAEVLTSMNHVLCRHLEHAYVTAVYAVVNTERQTVTIASAGHPPALLRRAHHTSPVHQNGGVMLGVFPEATYTNTEIAPFGAGDRLLLYSDGVLEARDRAGQFFDGERVARWLSDNQHTSAEQFADAAFRELTLWTGGGFEDDVTFVIARRAT